MRTCSIAGATGCYASFINGIYRATPDLSNGHLVYARDEVATNSGMFAEICIEFVAGAWEVKNVLCRGTRRCFARVSQDGPLESTAFLDTWLVSTGDGARSSTFAPQPDVCLRFSGDKRPPPKASVGGAAPAASPTKDPSSPSSADQHSSPINAAFETNDVDADGEPFPKVLADFFEVFACGSAGQMDTNLVAPTLQELDLEDEVHIVCGSIQQCAPAGHSAVLLCVPLTVSAGAAAATSSPKNVSHSSPQPAVCFDPASAASCSA
jgi:hypothetical protein